MLHLRKHKYAILFSIAISTLILLRPVNSKSEFLSEQVWFPKSGDPVSVSAKIVAGQPNTVYVGKLFVNPSEIASLAKIQIEVSNREKGDLKLIRKSCSCLNVPKFITFGSSRKKKIEVDLRFSKFGYFEYVLQYANTAGRNDTILRIVGELAPLLEPEWDTRQLAKRKLDVAKYHDFKIPFVFDINELLGGEKLRAQVRYHHESDKIQQVQVRTNIPFLTANCINVSTRRSNEQNLSSTILRLELDFALDKENLLKIVKRKPAIGSIELLLDGQNFDVPVVVIAPKLTEIRPERGLFISSRENGFHKARVTISVENSTGRPIFESNNYFTAKLLSEQGASYEYEISSAENRPLVRGNKYQLLFYVDEIPTPITIHVW